MKRKGKNTFLLNSIDEKLDRILELLEEKDTLETEVFKSDFGCREPYPWMEDVEPEGRNDINTSKVRLETHYWNSPNTIE